MGKLKHIIFFLMDQDSNPRTSVSQARAFTTRLTRALENPCLLTNMNPQSTENKRTREQWKVKDVYTERLGNSKPRLLEHELVTSLPKSAHY